MPAAVRLEQYFGRVGAIPGQLKHDRANKLKDLVSQTGISCDALIKCLLLIDLKGVVMAVIPVSHHLDIDAVNHKLGRHLQALHSSQADSLFPDCMPDIHPPVGMAYGLTTIIDQTILNWPKLYMQSGCPCTLLSLDQRNIKSVFGSAYKAVISEPSRGMNVVLGATESAGQPISLDIVAQKLQKLYRLPPMPAVAMKILKLVADPNSEVAALAALIETDPSLAAQVLRYARSSLFHFSGEIKTVKDAVNKVLGFDRVANLAVGLASGQAFNVPKSGPIGLDAFWQHALYASALSQKLAELLPAELKVDPGTAGLAGLLHNFGLLLIGHLFPPEFKMLNKLLLGEPDEPMVTLEHQVFGMGGAQEIIALGHASIGGVLLKLWGLPEEVVKVAGLHQSMHYEGEFVSYVKLIQLVNELLKPFDIGDEKKSQ
jgi:HD-like signal output (HDOD) protein/prolyl-tRNA editing enzyme YbaK/EbsC (Cys-tRNA(Pro) deacylase)